MGIDADRAATYVADGEGTDVMFAAMGDETVLMREPAAACAAARPRSAWKQPIERDAESRGKKRGLSRK